ncbi:MAG: Ig-like domain-containing protein [Pseudomonadota bacterium]
MSTTFSFGDLIFIGDEESVFGLDFDPIEAVIPLTFSFTTGFDIGGELGRVEVIPGFTIRIPFLPDIRVPPLVIDFDTELSAEASLSGEFGVELGFNVDLGSIESEFEFDALGAAFNGFRGQSGALSQFVSDADPVITTGEFETSTPEANAFLEAVLEFAFTLDVEGRLFGQNFLGGLLEDISFDSTDSALLDEILSGLAPIVAEDDDGNEIIDPDTMEPVLEQEAGRLTLVAAGTDGLQIIENPSPFVLNDILGLGVEDPLVEVDLTDLTFNAVIDPFTARLFIFTDNISFNGNGLGSGNVPPFNIDVGEFFFGVPDIADEGVLQPLGTVTSDASEVFAQLGFDVDIPVALALNVLTFGAIPTGTGFNASLLDGLIDLDVDLLDIDAGPNLSLTQELELSPNDLMLTLDFTDLAGMPVMVDALTRDPVTGEITETFTDVTSITVPFDEFPELNISDAVIATPTFSLAPTLDNLTSVDLGLFVDFVVGGLEAALNNPINLGPDTLLEIDVAIFEESFDGEDLNDLVNGLFNIDLEEQINDVLRDIGINDDVFATDGVLRIPVFNNDALALSNFSSPIGGDPFVFDIEQSGRNGGFTGIDDGVNTNAPQVTRDDTFVVPNLGLGITEDGFVTLTNEQLTANDFDLDAFDKLTVVEILDTVVANILNQDGDIVATELIDGSSLIFLNEDGSLTIDADGTLDFLAQPPEGANSVEFVATQVVEDAVGNVGVGEIAFIVTGTNDDPVAFDDAFASAAGASFAGTGGAETFTFSGLIDNDFDIDDSAFDLDGNRTLFAEDPNIPGSLLNVPGTNLAIAEDDNDTGTFGAPDVDPDIVTDQGGRIDFTESFTSDEFNYTPPTGPLTLLDGSTVADLASLDADDVFVDTFTYTLEDFFGGFDTATATIVFFGTEEAVVGSGIFEATNPLIFLPEDQLLFEDGDFGQLIFVPGADPSGNTTNDGTTDFELTFDSTEILITTPDSLTGATSSTDDTTDITTISFSLDDGAFGLPINFRAQALDDGVVEIMDSTDVTLTAVTTDADDGSPFLPNGSNAPGLSETVQVEISEPPAIIVSETEVTVGEDGTTATFTVGLNQAPAAGTTVLVALFTDNDAEFVISAPGMAPAGGLGLTFDDTFDPADPSDFVTVTVSVEDDLLLEGTEFGQISIVVDTMVSTDRAFDEADAESISVRVEDDENQAPIGVADPNVETTITFDADGNSIVTSTPTVDISVDEDGGPIMIDVLANDFDPDTGDNSTLSIATMDADGNDISPTADNGTVTVNADGTLNYTPNANFNGVDVITYAITDGGFNPDGSATITSGIPVLVTVNAVNDAPTLANDTFTFVEDENPTIDIAALIDDVDGETEFSLVSVTNSNLAGVVEIDPATGDPLDGTGIFRFDFIENFFNATNTEEDPLTGLTNRLDDAVQITGSDTVTATFVFADAAGAETTATFTFLITPVNDAPVATQIATATTAEEVAITFDDQDLIDNIDGILNNGVEVEDVDDDVPDAISITDVAAVPQITVDGVTGSAGTAVFASEGGELVETVRPVFDDAGNIIDIATGSPVFVPEGDIVFTPSGDLVDSLGVGESATATILFTFTDDAAAEGVGQIDVLITGVNDAPEAEDATFATLLSGALPSPVATPISPFAPTDTFDLSAFGTDVDGDDLTFSLVEGFSGDLDGYEVSVNSDGTFSITAPPFTDLPSGTGLADTFEFQVEDPFGATDTALVAVTFFDNLTLIPPFGGSAPGITVSASGTVTTDNGNEVNLVIAEGAVAPIVVGLTDVLAQGETVTLVVTVSDPSADDPAEAGAVTSLLTFTDIDQSARLVDIEAFQDGLIEDPEFVTITVSVVDDMSEARFGNVADITRDAEIVDAGSIIVSDPFLSITEGDNAEFTLALGTIPTGDVVLDITPLEADSPFSSTQITFESGDAGPQTVTLTTIDDDVIESLEFASLLISVNDDLTMDSRFADDGLIVDLENPMEMIPDTEFARDEAVVVAIADNDLPGLELSLSADAVAEGDSVIATVTRIGPFDEAVDVNLATLLPGDLEFSGGAVTTPATGFPFLSIPAGEVSAQFTITALADGVLEPNDEIATIVVAGPGGAPLADTALLTISDNGVVFPTLSIAIDPASISEASGVATGTVTLSEPLTDDLEVTLISSDTGEALVTDIVIIAAGDTEATFFIAAVDDAVVDGDQTVTITASGDGVVSGSAMLTVTDDDGVDLPDLNIVLQMDNVGEGDGAGASGGTVTIDSPLADDLVVTLASSDDTEAVATPSMVTITAGQTEAAFDIDAIEDAIVDGNQTIQITASATGFDSASVDLTVNDNDVVDAPSLIVTTTADTIDNTDGVTSLREAIAFANSNADTSAITFAAGTGEAFENGGTIVLDASLGRLITNQSTSIDGDVNDDGIFDVTLDGSNLSDLVLEVQSFNGPLPVMLEGLRITGGDSTGAATPTAGGLLFGNANGSVINSEFSGNVGGTGGGLAVVGLDDSATVTLSNVDIFDNDATVSGGGLFISAVGTGGEVNASDLVIQGNNSGGDGGGLALEQTSGFLDVSIDVASIGQNGADTGGGGISITGGELSLTNATLSGNFTAMGDGGGIANSGGILEAVNTTIVANSAFNGVGGGIALAGGEASLANSTITGNFAVNGGGGVSDTTNSNDLMFNNSIVLGNDATTDNDLQIPGSFGALGSILGTSLFTGSGTVNDPAVIVDLGDDGAALASQVFADTVNFLDLNGDGVQDSGEVAFDADVLGGVLADNGGLLDTVALLASTANPALDAGLDSNIDQSFDARGTGFDRIVDQTDVANNGDNTVDLGAFELQDQAVDPLLAPEIISAEAIDVVENQTVVIDIEASDDIDTEGAGLTFSFTTTNGGVDNDQFSLDPDTGVLAFNAAPDFENPGDDNGDNDYDVEVTVTDSDGLTDTQNIVVTVINEAAVLSLAIDPNTISENGGEATATLTRTGDTSGALLVTLASDMIDEATVPTDVELADGETSTTFIVTAVDDADVDGDQLVAVTASSVDSADVTATLTVTDDDIAMDPSDFVFSFFNADTDGFVTDFADGDAIDLDALAPSTRAIAADFIGDGVAGDDDGSLVFELQDDSGAVIATQTENFQPFAVFGDVGGDFNNSSPPLVDGDYTLMVTAFSANNGNGTVLSTETINFTIGLPEAELSLEIDPSTIAEDGTATATIMRTGDLTDALIVMLLSDDTTEAIVPLSVEIPSNMASAQFTVSGVLDSLIDSDQLVNITASASGFADASAALTVSDIDLGNAVLTIEGLGGVDEVSEGAAIQAMVTTSIAPEEDLVVSLASSDTGEATVPPTVTIPAGQTSVIFSISGVVDGETDNDQSVTITASAPGFISDASLPITVLDVPFIAPDPFVFALLDTNADEFVMDNGDIVRIEDGDVIDPSLVDPAFRSIAVDLNSEAFGGEDFDDDDFGSVVFSITNADTGEVLDTQTESVPLYVLTSNSGPNFANPDFDFSDGTFELTVTAFDGNAGTGNEIATQTISFTFGDDTGAPTIVSDPIATIDENQTFAIDVEAIDDLDTEGAGLTFAISGGADDDLFDIDTDTGELTFNTAPDFEDPQDANGDNIHEVEVTVTDSDGLTDQQTLSITVTDVEPEASSDGDELIQVTENSAPVSGNIFDNFFDIDPNDSPSVVSVVSNAMSTPGLDIDFTTGDFTFDPADLYETLVEGQVSGFSIDYTIDDGSGTQITSTIAVEVTGENDQPVDEDETVTFGDPLPNVLANASDPDTGFDPVEGAVPGGVSPDELSVIAVASSAGFVGAGTPLPGSGGGLFTITADGEVTFDLDGADELVADGDTGTTSVSYTIADDIGLTATSFLTVEFEGANTAPVISNDPLVVDAPENQSIAVDVDAADDFSSEGDGLIYTISGGVDADAFAIDTETGLVTFETAPDFEVPGSADGDNTFEVEVTVTDAGGLTDTETFEINVSDEDDDVIIPDDPVLFRVTVDGEQGGNGPVATVQTPTGDNDIEIGGNDTAGFLFQDIEIPDGAVIESAEIVFTSQRTQTGADGVNIRLFNSATVPAVLPDGILTSSGFDEFDTISFDQGNLADEEVFETPDISELINELLETDPQSDGTFDLLFALDTDSGIFRVEAEELEGAGEATAAQLQITFAPAPAPITTTLSLASASVPINQQLPVATTSSLEVPSELTPFLIEPEEADGFEFAAVLQAPDTMPYEKGFGEFGPPRIPTSDPGYNFIGLEEDAFSFADTDEEITMTMDDSLIVV